MYADVYRSTVSNFGISRKRMVVPMHRRWEASFARLQIVQRDTVIQLLVFFKHFPHGTCMNFVLKITDHFESFSKSVAKSEQYYIRIVDAKFALPRKALEPASDFVCLDTPEYPSEHDDVTIGFDCEAGKAAIPDGLKVLLTLFRTGQVWVGVTGSCGQILEVRYFKEGGVRKERGMSQRVAHTTSGGSPEKYPLSVQDYLNIIA